MPVEVTYIHHSGFAVRYSCFLLLFDFYSDPLRAGQRQANLAWIKQALCDPAVEDLFFFVSHRHRDHFDRDILALGTQGAGGPSIHYIFSDDVRILNKKDTFDFMAPGQTLQHAGILIRTFGSTDAGVSFWVEIPGLQVFHAGDLNWWYWHDESTPQELAEYERDFKAVVASMDGLRADIAFFPVDPRLGAFSHHGALHFIGKVRPRVFFPMHFGYDYAAAACFSDMAAQAHPEVRVIAPEHERQSFQLD